MEKTLNAIDCQKDARGFLQIYVDVDTNITSNVEGNKCAITEYREARWFVTYGKTDILKITIVGVIPSDVI